MNSPRSKASKARSVEKVNRELRAAWESTVRRQIAIYGGELERRGDTYVVKAPPETAPCHVDEDNQSERNCRGNMNALRNISIDTVLLALAVVCLASLVWLRDASAWFAAIIVGVALATKALRMYGEAASQ